MTRLAVLLIVAVVPACGVQLPRDDRAEEAARITGGDPARGRDEVGRHGLAACHTIPGVPGEANVGPPLERVGSRVYIGGVLVNTPGNLMRWLKDPPAVDPKTAMPNVGLSEDDARDVAAFLYTLR